jgi:hypothetical protein
MALRTIGVLLIMYLLAVVAPAAALETLGTPAWLAAPITPAWRLAPLDRVLDQLATLATVPLRRSNGVASLAPGQFVVLVDGRGVALRAVLEQLERDQRLYITAAAGGLQVETEEEAFNRRREMRIYSLAEFGLSEQPSLVPGNPPGIELEDAGAAVRGQAAPTDHPDLVHAPPYDPAVIVDHLQRTIDHAVWSRPGMGIEQRLGDELHITAPPETQARIRAFLLAYATDHPQRRWQVRTGLLPAGADCPAGVVTSAQALALAERLSETGRLTLSGPEGQHLCAEAVQEGSVVASATVVAGHLEAHNARVITGRSAEVSTVVSAGFAVVTYQFGWAEKLGEAARATFCAPAGPLPDLTITHAAAAPVPTTAAAAAAAVVPVPAAAEAAATAPAADAIPAAPAAAAAPAARESTVTVERRRTSDGETLTLEQPTLWLWKPAGDCYLQVGKALVLTSEHPRGQAVLILVQAP